MSDFNVKFRGVRGSFPVADKDYLSYGGNTSCVEVNVGGHLIILDAGTGIVNIGDELMTNYISSGLTPEDRTPINASILISHIHQDHLLGLTFFKPLHIKSSNINIFGPGDADSSLCDNLSNLVFGKTFPIDLGDISCKLHINDIQNEGKILFSCGKSPVLVDKNYPVNENDVCVEFYKSYVHPQDGVIVYKIIYQGKSLVYATDKECYVGGDKKFAQFAKNCSLLIHDSQYTTEDYLSPYSPKQGYGHSTYDMAIEVMKQTNAENIAFFHYDPNYNDSKLDSIKEYFSSDYKNIIFAQEGLELNL